MGKERRVVAANFWRNAREEEPIMNQHLVMLDAETVSEEEMEQTKFKNYAIGGQEQHMMWRVKDEHQFVYFPKMTQNEILVFKQGEYNLRKVGNAFDVIPAFERRTNHIF